MSAHVTYSGELILPDQTIFFNKNVRIEFWEKSPRMSWIFPGVCDVNSREIVIGEGFLPLLRVIW